MFELFEQPDALSEFSAHLLLLGLVPAGDPLELSESVSELVPLLGVLEDALLLGLGLEGQLLHQLTDLRLVLRAQLLQTRPTRLATLLLSR